MLYKKGYKYQLTAEDYTIKLSRGLCDLLTTSSLSIDFIDIKDGRLVVRKGYAWDGPSGPTFDTKTFMRGSLVHDVLYQLIRNNHLTDNKAARKFADQLLKRICLEDGMMKVRAWWVYKVLRAFGKPATSYKRIKKVFNV